MKWLFFNCRGLASPSKKLALKRLLCSELCDIIFLQETLGRSEQIVKTLLTIMPGWHFQSLDAARKSRGIALGVNPQSIKLTSTWGGHGFLGMDIFSAKLGRSLYIMSIYVPNHSRLDFWQKILENPLLNHSIILGGALNFTIGHEESWGHHSQLDPLSDQLG